VALAWTPAEKLFNMFSRESAGGAGGGAGAGGDGEGSKGEGSKGGWSTWMGMVFVCLALVNYLTSQASSGSQQRTSSQGRQGASGGQQGQQGARESKPQPEADAGAQSRSSAASSGVDSSRTPSGVNSSSRSPGAAGGSARGTQDEGARQRPAAAAPAASGKDDLTNRLGNCSVITPPPRLLSHLITFPGKSCPRSVPAALQHLACLSASLGSGFSVSPLVTCCTFSRAARNDATHRGLTVASPWPRRVEMVAWRGQPVY
jgi:hypothetical protein